MSTLRASRELSLMAWSENLTQVEFNKLVRGLWAVDRGAFEGGLGVCRVEGDSRGLEEVHGAKLRKALVVSEGAAEREARG